jgi:hypothetical protein
MVEPEVVATSPNPIKSRVPVCCGFSSLKVARQAEAQRAKIGARGRIRTCTGDALDVVSLLLDYASKEIGSSSRCCPGRIALQKRTAACCMEANGSLGRSSVSEGWSQSRVLPSAELAYETGLSAGSIAKWGPHPELHRVGSPTERAHHWKCFEALEMVGMKRAARFTSRMSDERSADELHPQIWCARPVTLRIQALI